MWEAVTFLLHVKFLETPPPEFVGLCGHGIDTINQINEWMFLLSEHLPGNFMESVRKAPKMFQKSLEMCWINTELNGRCV